MTLLEDTELLLWHGDSSGTQEGVCPPLEADTRGLVKGQTTKKTQRELQWAPERANSR
jgi:hypothetical protein